METASAGQFRVRLAALFHCAFGEYVQVGVIYFAFTQPFRLVGLMLTQKSHAEIVTVDGSCLHSFGTVLYQRRVLIAVDVFGDCDLLVDVIDVIPCKG